MNNFLFSIYNKIIKQSKKIFFFDDFLIPDLFLARLEIFQLNLIMVLWYMKFSKIKKNHLEDIINFFLKDLELLLRESGEAESRIPRKTRKLVENFYGRLAVYSQQFDLIIKKRKNQLKEKLQQNFLHGKLPTLPGVAKVLQITDTSVVFKYDNKISYIENQDVHILDKEIANV